MAPSHMATSLLLLHLLILLSSSLTVGQEGAAIYEEYSTASETWRKNGEEQVEKIRREAQHSSCWREALVSLETSCKNLSDSSQSRLALSFANCHLEKSGRMTYPCPSGRSIKDCTSPEVMDNFAFQTYTEFFTHSSHMCFYLQSAVWRERTERTIDSLGKTSVKVVRKLEESLEYHRTMEGLQSRSLSNQEAILSQDEKIADSIEKGHTKFSNYFTEMSEKAEKQKLLLDSIFGTLNKGLGSIEWFLTSILGEIMSFETVIFFFITFVVLTFLPQFGYTRLWHYSTLLVYGMLEGVVRRSFIWYYGLQTPGAMSLLHTVLWYSRLLILLLLTFLYVWNYLVYSDAQSKQLKLLEGINERLQLLLPRREERQVTDSSERVEFDGVVSTPSSMLPPGIPLSQLYDSGHHDTFPPPPPPAAATGAGGYHVKSGTQLLDFLSSIYIKNGIYDTVTINSIDDDDTYKPPPLDQHCTEESSSSSSSLLHSSLLRPPLSHTPVRPSLHHPRPTSYHSTPHRRTVQHQGEDEFLDDSGIHDHTPTGRYNLRPRRSTPRRF